MSLEKVGVNSLLAVNDWIGIINSNLQGTSRTGYKPTKAILSDGLGINTVSDELSIPASTLTVQATTVEWGQGTVINTGINTDFALQGEGFFVVTDGVKYYATRDGNFHWGTDGYLYNSAGLHVVSNGQDYIRYHHSDREDTFNGDGESQHLTYYGDKSFLIVDVGNRDGLRMSKYGATTFELGGDLPFRVKNEFDETTDGISYIDDDTLQVGNVSHPGFIPNTGAGTSDVIIDFGSNGVLSFPLDPTTDTIQDFVNAINGVANVTAYFDPNGDRLFIENDATATGGDDRIDFGGPNGYAIAEFFQLSNINGPTGGGIRDIQSTRDIDNSAIRTAADITTADVGTLTFNDLLIPVPGTVIHDKTNGWVRFNSSGATLGQARVAIGEAQQTAEFEIVTDYRYDGNGTLRFAFAQGDAHVTNSGGFELRYDTNTGAVELFKLSEDNNVTATSIAVLGNVGGSNEGFADPTVHQMVVTLNKEGLLTFGIDGNTVTYSLSSAGESLSGYLSLTNTAAQFEMRNIYADFKHKYNTALTGGIEVHSPTNYAAVEVRRRAQDRPRVRIIQAAEEQSTASLTEYVPMLSLAQKVFSAVSKIISVHNATVDDLNTLIR